MNCATDADRRPPAFSAAAVSSRYARAGQRYPNDEVHANATVSRAADCVMDGRQPMCRNREHQLRNIGFKLSFRDKY